MTRALALVLLLALAGAACADRRAGDERGHATPAASAVAHADPHDHGPAAGHEAHGTDPTGHEEHEHDHEPGVVLFSAQDQRAHGVHVAPVAAREVERQLETTGEIAENTDAEAHVTTRVPGRVVRVRKTVGDWVRAGETLALVESDALGEAQAGFLEAHAHHRLAAATLARQQRLHHGELTARKELLAAEHELRMAEIELERARNRLSLMGVDARRQARLAASRRLDPSVAVTAPIAGLIVAKHVTLGEVLEPKDEPAFTISDPTALWVNANLYERDLARVKPGMRATVVTPAFPGRAYGGRVSLISTTLDKDTRTARARIVVANVDRSLKPGMFATVRIAAGRTRALVVPVAAVLFEREEAFVFVREGPERFERRKVVLEPPNAGVHPVVSGLRAGEPIVTAGAFTLKSELMKESFGGHAH